MARRKVYVEGELVPEGWGGPGTISAADVRQQIGAGTFDTLEVHFNSVGGVIWEGAAIAEAIWEADAKEKIGIIDGICASAATYPFMVCDERYISTLGQLFIHNSGVFLFGTAKTLRAVADDLEQTDAMVAEFYAARTGKSIDAIRDWMDTETVFTPQATVDQGFALEVLTDTCSWRKRKSTNELSVNSSRYHIAKQQTEEILRGRLLSAKVRQLLVNHKKEQS